MTTTKKPLNSLAIQRTPGIEYSADPQPEHLVFVCGLHRSGTSLLEQMLVSQLDLSCLRMRVPENEGQHAQTVYSPARAFGGPGRFAFSEDMQRELISLRDFNEHRKTMLSDWTPFMVGSSTTLIEKSPPNLTKIWWLRKVFPGAKFVIVVRDPRAVAGATQKWSQTSLEELVMHWHVAHSRALKDISTIDCITVKYEDLVAAPDEVIHRIAQFLGAAWRPKNLPVADQYRKLLNSNDKYIAIHSCRFYGKGAWDDFGYC
jgi:hypothetical protein